MLTAALFILLGFIGLVWSADRFVDGAAAMARNYGMSPLMIGLTIVSLGTSAPEIIVSISAALSGSGDIAIGNALGSNLANVGLVLGITALISPTPIGSALLKREIPILLLVTLTAGAVLYDLHLALIDSIILLVGLVAFLGIMIYRKSHHIDADDDTEDPELQDLSPRAAWMWFLIGLVTLIGSSQLLINGSQTVALELGVSELIIGLTVIAVGTSLPELAASAMSAIRGHHDIALGNIIGSNIFNILAVMSMPGLFTTLDLEAAVFSRDYLAMLGITLALIAIIVIDRSLLKDKSETAKIGRLAGVSLLAMYGGYYYHVRYGSVAIGSVLRRYGCGDYIRSRFCYRFDLGGRASLICGDSRDSARRLKQEYNYKYVGLRASAPTYGG